MVDSINRAQFSVIQETDLDSMDLESAMMFVQTKRAENMEVQLRDQLKEVQARNEKNAKLNEFLQALVAIGNSLKSGAKNEDKIGDNGYEAGKDLAQLAKNANLVMDFFKKTDTSAEIKSEKESIKINEDNIIACQKEIDALHDFKNPDYYTTNSKTGENQLNEKGEKWVQFMTSQIKTSEDKIKNSQGKISDLEFAAQGSFSKSTTKGDIETAISKIKGQLDTNNSNNQLDMLRLQSLNSKRNEAFELLTNFIKKMLDSRLSIVSNMR